MNKLDKIYKYLENSKKWNIIRPEYKDKYQYIAPYSTSLDAVSKKDVEYIEINNVKSPVYRIIEEFGYLKGIYNGVETFSIKIELINSILIK